MSLQLLAPSALKESEGPVNNLDLSHSGAQSVILSRRIQFSRRLTHLEARIYALLQ